MAALSFKERMLDDGQFALDSSGYPEYRKFMKRKTRGNRHSQVARRVVRPRIGTFGGLEKHLELLEKPLNVDFDAFDRTRKRKRKANASDPNP